MKILGHRHTGIIVQDFNKMLDFYIGLGLELRRRDIEKGAFVGHLLNTENIILETAKLVLQDESVPLKLRFNLELMKIVDNETASNSDRYEVDKFDFNQRQIGILDLAFTVDDITSVLKYITDNGGDLISEPLESPAGFPALHSYARDPEGNVLHIAQNINL
jgi:catechol 2,3-dioxygenase-like lactoylglutathione lyase family enzyme